MKLRLIATLTALGAAAATASAALVTTTYPAGPAEIQFTGAGALSIPGFEEGYPLFYTFAFEGGPILPYDNTPYPSPGILVPMTLSITAGDLTVSSIGHMRYYFKGAVSAEPGWYYYFEPSATSAAGIIEIDGIPIDTSTGLASIEFEIYQGGNMYPGPFLYGLIPPLSLDLIDLPPEWGFHTDGKHFDIALGLDLGAHALRIAAPGLVVVPEPSTYGLLGAGVLLGAALVRRRLIRS